MRRLTMLFACLLPLTAQQKTTFEVASVKPSSPVNVGDPHNFRQLSGPRFGPGTADATRWVCDNCSVGMLLAEAYNLKRFQITGPKWLDSERFDIVARVPEGATRDDLRVMQQNLLAERFGIKARTEKKEMQVFDLVAAKPKLTAAAPPKPGAEAQPRHFDRGGPSARPTQFRMSADGFPDHNTGRTMTITMHGATRHQAVGEDMQQFADFLAAQLDRPVTDSTGLAGKFDFLLTFSGGKGMEGGSAMGMMMHGAGAHAEDPDATPQPPLMKAIQDQLGLRLEGKKGMADILIIDHIEKAPTGN